MTVHGGSTVYLDEITGNKLSHQELGSLLVLIVLSGRLKEVDISKVFGQEC